MELHYEKRLPLTEIAKMYNSTYRSLHIYMKHLNLPVRRTRIKEHSSGYKIKKIDIPKEKLYELYYEQKLSLQKIDSPIHYTCHRSVTRFGVTSIKIWLA